MYVSNAYRRAVINEFHKTAGGVLDAGKQALNYMAGKVGDMSARGNVKRIAGAASREADMGSLLTQRAASPEGKAAVDSILSGRKMLGAGAGVAGLYGAQQAYKGHQQSKKERQMARFQNMG